MFVDWLSDLKIKYCIRSKLFHINLFNKKRMQCSKSDIQNPKYFGTQIISKFSYENLKQNQMNITVRLLEPWSWNVPREHYLSVFIIPVFAFKRNQT